MNSYQSLYNESIWFIVLLRLVDHITACRVILTVSPNFNRNLFWQNYIGSGGKLTIDSLLILLIMIQSQIISHITKLRRITWIIIPNSVELILDEIYCKWNKHILWSFILFPILLNSINHLMFIQNFPIDI